MPRTHKHYDAAIRQEALELALTSGKPFRDVARDLGVSVDTLLSWRQKQERQPVTSPATSAETPSDLERENQRLRRELAYTQRQHEIQKKPWPSVGAARAAGRFTLIEQMAMHTGESIQLLCQTLGVSRAGFYAHRH